MFDVNYWNDRMALHGHTGHAEPFYYCFDQEARLYAIDQILKQYSNSNNNNSLDYGCGSGEFIGLLAQYFKKVFAYDISDKIIEQAKKKYQSANIRVSSSIEELNKTDKLDCILTVTVLQTMNGDELKNNIQLLSKKLSEHGVMILMEFFIEDNIKIEEDKATIADFNQALMMNNLEIVEKRFFYNPILCPTQSWKAYNRSFFLKLVKLFKNTNSAKNIMKDMAKKYINQYQDVILTEPNQFKIYVVRWKGK